MGRMMKDCSVIVVSYHTGPVLFASIKNILRQKQLKQLVIVDNGNPPDVVARMQQLALGDARISVITGHGNVGFAAACNMGARQVTSDYMLLVNPDCLIPPDGLIKLMDAMENTPGAMLGSGFLQNPDGSEQRGGRRQLLTPVTALSEALCLHKFLRVKRLNDHESTIPDHIHEVPAISGACMCIRTQDYQRLFGLDEGFFLHVEDLDFCMRVNKVGGKIICVPEVRLTHMKSTSGEVTSRFLEWNKAKGFMRYFKKHFDGKYVPGLLTLVNAAVLARYFLKTTIGDVKRILKRGQTPHNTTPSKRLMILAAGIADMPEDRAFYGKTVLLTGATSQIGLCVLKRLIASGASVLAISRGPVVPYEHEHLRWIIGDLTAADLHLDDYLIDAVVHCAPLWHLPPIIDLLAEAGVRRIVAFGSTSIFAKASSKNHYERDVVDKLVKAEAAVAEQCQQKNIAGWTILRPTMIYGVGLDLNVTSLAKFIERFKCFPVYPPAFGRRQPVHADDLAIAVTQVLNNTTSFGKAYNVSGGEIVTYREMLERLFEIYHLKRRIIATTMLPFLFTIAGFVFRRKHINGEIAHRMNDDLIFFHDEAKRDFGYAPRPFLSGGMTDIEGV
jgi:GT2 family glycosyltransferase/nucleoside-diphosphate-sugar epimerase